MTRSPACLAALRGLADDPQPPPAGTSNTPCFALRRPGLREAAAHRHTAYWAPWMDTLPVIRARARAPLLPRSARLILCEPAAGRLPSLVAAVQAAAYRAWAGYAVPSWRNDALSAVLGWRVPRDEPVGFPRG